jgi:ABC-2 type transport system permease protein
MIALRDIYLTQLKIWLAIHVQYRVEMLIWLLERVLTPVIYLVVWTTVAHSHGGAVKGYAAADIAAYYLAVMLVNNLTYSWVMWDYEYRIHNGTLSPLLLRPIHPIHGDIAENIASKLLTTLVMIPIVLVLAVLFQAAVHPQPWMIVAFVPALLLACAVRFLVEWVLSLIAFWTTRVNAINMIYFTMLLFCSGQMAPLDLLPPWLQTSIAVLPFRWMIAFPVDVVLGRLTVTETLLGLLSQSIWLAGTLIVLIRLWRTAVRRYSAVGA